MATYDGEVLRIYLNGTLAGSNNGGAGSYSPSTNDIFIGRHPSLSWRQWEGAIDDVRLYNRQLTAEDAYLLANSFPYALPACNADYEAVMQYNAYEKVMQYCNGTEWISVGKEQAANPSDGLVAHWPLDDTGTSASDVSGGNTGTMQGGLDGANDSIKGIHGTAMHFDGVDDRIDIPAFDITGGTGMSISAWINMSSYDGVETRVISKAGGEATHLHDWVMFFDNPDGTLSFRLTTQDSGGNADNAYSTYTVPHNE